MKKDWETNLHLTTSRPVNQSLTAVDAESPAPHCPAEVPDYPPKECDGMLEGHLLSHQRHANRQIFRQVTEQLSPANMIGRPGRPSMTHLRNPPQPKDQIPWMG